MISTFFGADALGRPGAWLAALCIGIAFGAVLERAGFGSSRKLCGVFYFRDMAVIKVMFTAVITAMIGLNLCLAAGWVDSEQLFFMSTFYGAQGVGGLVFGIGFVMGGWCPGTAVVGAASGKTDALVFLGGTGLGSIVFNEVFGFVKPLHMAGDRGVLFVYDALRLRPATFALLFTGAGVVVFWACEQIERRGNDRATYFGTPFLKAFSLALLVAAGAVCILSTAKPVAVDALANQPADGKAPLLTQVAEGQDHIAPETLADWLVAGEKGISLVDVRPADEFAAFHLRGAVNLPLEGLAATLQPMRDEGQIVLYSNGMAYPAQAHGELARAGFANVSILTLGLNGFVERCLKPVSLRGEPVPPEQASRIRAWRAFFLETAVAAP